MGRESERERAGWAMDRYAGGDDAAFAELYGLLAPGLLGFAMSLARRRAPAEDLVQQTFLQLHRSRARWVPGARVVPYAYAVARHHFIDSTLRTRRERLSSRAVPASAEPAAQAPRTDDALDGRRRLALVLAQLQLLPAHHRLAFQLVVLEELPVAAAAEVLGLGPGNVRVQVHRAREALRRLQDPPPATAAVDAAR